VELYTAIFISINDPKLYKTGIKPFSSNIHYFNLEKKHFTAGESEVIVR